MTTHDELISPEHLRDVHALSQQFARGEPFRHVVIDDFLEEGYAQRLLADFPPFESGNARNEAGELGNKSVIERIRGIGPAYAALDDVIQTPGFLDWVGRVTGIPGLLYDPYYFGGGTHENREGQDLDPHIDFNRHPVEQWHRRLNLIVYLNPEWDDAWGGSLELHSDPRDENDRVELITPSFNRCVIFETNEISWHGFSRIGLPAERRGTTRRSIALYFYTRERPAAERADTHSTIYVDRPLPDHLRVGHQLRAEDVEELRVLVKRRDMHIQRLYRDLTSYQKQLDSAQAALYAGRLGRLRYLAARLLRTFRG